jgi:hypothetical protein
MKTLILFIIPMLLFSAIGNVTIVRGEANILRADQLFGIKKGTPIHKGDIIHTYKRAKVGIRLKDNTNITIGVSSKVAIKDFLYNEHNTSLSMHFTKGFFRTITGKIGKLAPTKVHLTTKTATLGIRGTTIVGHITDEQEMIACLDGAISVEANGGGVEFPATNYTQIIHPNPPTIPQKACAKEISFFYKGLLEKVSFTSFGDQILKKDNPAALKALKTFREEKYEESLAQFDTLLIHNPCSSILHFYKGRSAYELGLMDVAGEAFENVLAYDPNHIKSLFFMAEINLELHRIKRALNLFKRVAKSKEKQFKNYRKLAIEHLNKLNRTQKDSK